MTLPACQLTACSCFTRVLDYRLQELDMRVHRQFLVMLSTTVATSTSEFAESLHHTLLFTSRRINYMNDQVST